MPFTLTMPKLSPTMEEGVIVKWTKKVGDHVEAGDVIMEVSTDKATVEYNAIDGGWLRKILVNEGKEAHLNQPIAILTEEKDESIEGYKPEGEEPAAPIKESEKKETAKTESKGEKDITPKQPKGALLIPAFVPEPPLENYSFTSPTETSKRIPASPLARKLAEEKSLDLTTVKGTGPNQRIMSRDLEKAQPIGEFVFGHREAPTEVPGSLPKKPSILCEKSLHNACRNQNPLFLIFMHSKQ